jgi:hypothetical protein
MQEKRDSRLCPFNLHSADLDQWIYAMEPLLAENDLPVMPVPEGSVIITYTCCSVPGLINLVGFPRFATFNRGAISQSAYYTKWLKPTVPTMNYGLIHAECEVRVGVIQQRLLRFFVWLAPVMQGIRDAAGPGNGRDTTCRKRHRSCA